MKGMLVYYSHLIPGKLPVLIWEMAVLNFLFAISYLSGMVPKTSVRVLVPDMLIYVTVIWHFMLFVSMLIAHLREKKLYKLESRQ